MKHPVECMECNEVRFVKYPKAAEGKRCKSCKQKSQILCPELARARGIKIPTVYYIPSKHYVGITTDLYNRISQHKYNGIDITDWTIVSNFDSIEEALIEEARYHSMGYNGCKYTELVEYNRPLYNQ